MITLREKLVIQLAQEDSTFKIWEKRYWAGKCIHCNSHITVGIDGQLLSATIEHIVPQGHGGTNAIENLALSCAPCNHRKGREIDVLKEGNPKYHSVVENLLKKKSQRRRKTPMVSTG